MSRFLNLLKNKKIFFLCVLMLFYIIALIFDTKNRTCISIFFLFVIVLYVLNIYTYRRILDQVKDFLPFSNVRNIDYLVIGDICSIEALVPEGKTVVQVLAPERSLQSSFEILKHTFSILSEENANVIITVKKKNIDDEYSLFDFPVFKLSSTTLKRLRIAKNERQLRFPIFFEPLKSVRYLLGIRGVYCHTLDKIPEEIAKFCSERNISVQIYTDTTS